MPNPTQDLTNALNALIDERINTRLATFTADVHADGTITGTGAEDSPFSVNHLVNEVHRLDGRIDDVGTALGEAASAASRPASTITASQAVDGGQATGGRRRGVTVSQPKTNGYTFADVRSGDTSDTYVGRVVKVADRWKPNAELQAVIGKHTWDSMGEARTYIEGLER